MSCRHLSIHYELVQLNLNTMKTKKLHRVNGKTFALIEDYTWSAPYCKACCFNDDNGIRVSNCKVLSHLKEKIKVGDYCHTSKYLLDLCGIGVKYFQEVHEKRVLTSLG